MTRPAQGNQHDFVAHMRFDLQLVPHTLEQEFWGSREAMRGLYLADGAACALALVQCTSGLSKALKHTQDCTQSRTVPLVMVATSLVYAVGAVITLLLMALSCSRYHKLRHNLAWFNRLVRVALSTLQRCISASNCGVAVAIAAHVQGLPPMQALLKNLVQPTIFWAQQAQFVVPWRWAFLFQAVNFAAVAWGWSADLPCWLVHQSEPGDSLVFQAEATAWCHVVNAAMSVFGSMCGDPSLAALDSNELCRGSTAVQLLQLFATALQMLALPLVAIFWLELSLKRSFLAARNMQLVASPIWGSSGSIANPANNHNSSTSSSSTSSSSSSSSTRIMSSSTSSTASTTNPATSISSGAVTSTTGSGHEGGVMLTGFFLLVGLLVVVWISWSVALMLVWEFRGRDCSHLLNDFPVRAQSAVGMCDV